MFARKIEGKPRPICYAAHLDSLIFSWYGYLLNHWYEEVLHAEGIADVVLAYRKLEKTTPHFVREVCDYIKAQKECVALCFDVSGFFDHIDHGKLKGQWLRVAAPHVATTGGKLPDDHHRVFRAATAYRYVQKESLEKLFPKGKIPARNGRYLPKINCIEWVVRKDQDLKQRGLARLVLKNLNDFGVPQGLPLSGVLANISMLDFDKEMASLAAAHGGIYRRYSDDILLVVERGSDEPIKASVEASLRVLGLESNGKKYDKFLFTRNGKGDLSCVNKHDKPSHFQYLGIEFDGKTLLPQVPKYLSLLPQPETVRSQGGLQA